MLLLHGPIQISVAQEIIFYVCCLSTNFMENSNDLDVLKVEEVLKVHKLKNVLDFSLMFSVNEGYARNPISMI